jgi:hypothetical protein
MTDELYRCLAGSTTVYTESPAPDVAHLAPLAAVALSKLEKSTPGAATINAAIQNAGPIDVSGQVIRMAVHVVRPKSNRRDILVGRMSGRPDQPWITLDQWSETGESICPALVMAHQSDQIAR